MRITYLGHSGFLLETEAFDLIFDYYTGDLPTLSDKKETVVFVSHNHYDHMNPAIFKICAPGKRVQYVLSSDVPPSLPREYGVEEFLSVEPAKLYRLKGGRLRVRTLRSTDAGVAFLVTTEQETIFHAGDLNLWLWDGMSEEEVYAMTKTYRQYIAALRGTEIDVAFLPLDNRQGQYAFLNIDYCMRHFHICRCIPMHYFGTTKICDALLDSEMSRDYRNRIVKMKPYGTVAF